LTSSFVISIIFFRWEKGIITIKIHLRPPQPKKKFPSFHYSDLSALARIEPLACDRQIKMQTYTPEKLLGPLNDVETRYAPRVLFAAGDVSLLGGLSRVAVIGTRHPSDKGKARAARLARVLVEHASIVVSGLAEGIDTIAHCSAIKKGGRTIAVLGTSLDEVYPKRNYALQQEIMGNHLAISQFPRGWPIQRKNFPLRNRTMALIVDASVIVEAGDGSGTLSQGWEMLRLGRPLFILKSVCEDRSLSWPRKMFEYGAIPLSEPELLLEVLPVQNTSRDRHVTL
jgi:DNA processing protein